MYRTTNQSLTAEKSLQNHNTYFLSGEAEYCGATQKKCTDQRCFRAAMAALFGGATFILLGTYSNSPETAALLGLAGASASALVEWCRQSQPD